MAQTFRQRIAQAEAMARADMLRFQPEVLQPSSLKLKDFMKANRTLFSPPCHVKLDIKKLYWSEFER